MACDAPHPDNPEWRCEIEDGALHPADHRTRTPEGLKFWPWTEFVLPPQPERPRRPGSEAQRLRDLARRVHQHEREAATSAEPPRDLDQAHSWLRHDAHHTEVIAADISQVRNSRRRKQVLRLIVAGGEAGATYDEVAVILNDPHVPAPRVASRGKELWEWGWIEPQGYDNAGHPITRITRAGGEAIVWIVTAQGRALLGPWLYEEVEGASDEDEESVPAAFPLMDFG